MAARDSHDAHGYCLLGLHLFPDYMIEEKKDSTKSSPHHKHSHESHGALLLEAEMLCICFTYMLLMTAALTISGSSCTSAN